MVDCGAVDDAPTRSFWFHSEAATHEGSVRSVNEDAYLDRKDVGLWAVADGMGGHDAGDYASRLVIDCVDRRINPAVGALDMHEIAEALDGCNAVLQDFASRIGRQVVGSTVVVLGISGPQFSCVWAGDSRLYRMRGGVLEQITRDHSYVQELIDSGLLDPAAAEGHEKANVITRAVGATEALRLDAVTDRVEDGDLFVLCSDGLTKVLRDEEIAAVLRGSTLAGARDELLRLVLERGARDNVTVVLVQCEAVARR